MQLIEQAGRVTEATSQATPSSIQEAMSWGNKCRHLKKQEEGGFNQEQGSIEEAKEAIQRGSKLTKIVQCCGPLLFPKVFIEQSIEIAEKELGPQVTSPWAVASQGNEENEANISIDRGRSKRTSIEQTREHKRVHSRKNITIRRSLPSKSSKDATLCQVQERYFIKEEAGQGVWVVA